MINQSIGQMNQSGAFSQNVPRARADLRSEHLKPDEGFLRSYTFVSVRHLERAVHLYQVALASDLAQDRANASSCHPRREERSGGVGWGGVGEVRGGEGR